MTTTDAVHVVYWFLFNGLHLFSSQTYIHKQRYNDSTEPIDAVNILPLARLEPTTMTTPPIYAVPYFNVVHRLYGLRV